MAVPKKIYCAICKKPAKATHFSCESCSGRVVKLCGACGFEISASKRYCDSCGEEQSGSHTPAPFQAGHTPLPPIMRKDAGQPPPKESSSPSSAEDEMRRKKLMGMPDPMRTPMPQPRDRAPRSKGVPDNARKTITPTEFKRRSDRRKPVFSTVIGLLLLVGGGGLYGWFFLQRRSPAQNLQQAASKYLESLAAGQMKQAYMLLSSAARNSCTLGCFGALQAKGKWAHSNLEIKSLDETHALVVYDLKEKGWPKERDGLHFTLDDGKWRRAFWWHLMKPIEEDLEDGDSESAYARAQTAKRINPREPMVAAYLCEAAYAQEAWELAEKECRLTLKLSEMYPSRLGRAGLFRARGLLAEIYRYQLDRLKDAARQYEVLLAFPGLKNSDRCRFQLAAADTQLQLEQWPKAAKSYAGARVACRDPEEIGYLQRGARMLSGAGGKEAVFVAQRYKMPGDAATLLEWRQQSKQEIADRLQTGTPGVYSERWEAKHVGGPKYTVSVLDGATEVLSIAVNLWTHKIKVKINVPKNPNR